MKFIKFFIAAAVAFFSLQFSTASAATPAMAEGTSLHAAKATPAQQQHRRHRRMHHRRIHRHKK